MDKSIYALEKKYDNIISDYMKPMKKIIVKGIGYIVVSNSFKVTPDALVNIAASMEKQGIKEL